MAVITVSVIRMVFFSTLVTYQSLGEGRGGDTIVQDLKLSKVVYAGGIPQRLHSG